MWFINSPSCFHHRVSMSYQEVGKIKNFISRDKMSIFKPYIYCYDYNANLN